MPPNRLCLLLLLTSLSCVAYVDAPADATSTAEQIRRRPGGRLTFARAVATAFSQNAELQALAARARAAGAVTTPIEVESEWRSETDMLAVLVDPVALLGLGPRGASQRIVEAEAATAVQELAAARWLTIGKLAEAFAVEGALRDLSVPAMPVAIAKFVDAGLASPVAAQKLHAAAARAAAEALELETARATNLADLRQLLGLHGNTPVEFELGAGELVPSTTASDSALLRRPDLALAAARFQLADAELRSAIADQYPSLRLGPEVPLRSDPWQAMAVLRLPIGAHGRAVAAGERREAARAELAAAYLAASREAHHAELEVAAATGQARAAAMAQRTSATALHAALIAIEVDDDDGAVDRLGDAATMALRETMELRTAAVVAARATVRAAIACGWPATEGVQ